MGLGILRLSETYSWKYDQMLPGKGHPALRLKVFFISLVFTVPMQNTPLAPLSYLVITVGGDAGLISFHPKLL